MAGGDGGWAPGAGPWQGRRGRVRTLRVLPPSSMIGWEGTTPRPLFPRPPARATPVSQSDCLFCRIVAGSIPANVIHQDEDVIAFRDISPQAPVHVLVIPREHIPSLDAAADAHGKLMGKLLHTARDVARAEGIADGGYRAVLNVGADAGQAVHHIHLHVLGGRGLGWPPG